MSLLHNAIPLKRTPSHRLSLASISALFGALLLAIFSGAASAQTDGAIGRGFTGVAMSVDAVTGLMTVESKGAFFQLVITDDTVINNLPGRDVGLAGLPTERGFRIAGLVNLRITDADGNVTPELLTAQNITVIPGKATRKHRRTIALDKQGNVVTTLDDDGTQTEVPGRGDGFEKGDTIIMLVQASGQGGIGETIRGLFRASIVAERLDRLAKAEAGDSVRAANLAILRNRRADAQERRLQRTADNAGTDLRDFVLSTVRKSQETTETGQAIPGDTVTIEPPIVHIISPSPGTVVAANDVITITAEAKATAGLASVTFNVAGSDLAPMTEGPYFVAVTVPTSVSSVPVKVTAVDANGNTASDAIFLRVARATDVGVTITSPAAAPVALIDRAGNSRVSTVSGSNDAIAEGETIKIQAEVSGTSAITVVFAVDAVGQTPISAPPYSMSYLMPLTPVDGPPPTLRITATATDGSGNTASDSVSVTVVRKTSAVNVEITEPPANAKVKAGETIVIRAETNDDSEITFVTFSVDGKETVRTAPPFTHAYTVPQRASSAAAVSSIPPNVFVGTATLDGATAPDGTVVIAWIAGSDATTLTIKVTAVASSGVTGSASLSLLVSGSINAGEGTVTNGKYTLNAAQPSGQNFTGKTVTFTVGGKDARQTATWRKGDADAVNLTAN